MGRSNESSIIYVRKQLAKATAKERIKKLTSKYEAKQMKLARVNRLSAREKGRMYSSKSSLTSLTTKLANYHLVVEKRPSAREKRRKYNNKGSFKSFKILDSCNEQPDVRTQPAVDALALVMLAKASIMSSLKIMNYNKLPYIHAHVRTQLDRNTESSTNYVRKQLAIATYVRTQLATATKGRKIIKIKLISVKNHAYLLLTTFADPS